MSKEKMITAEIRYGMEILKNDYKLVIPELTEKEKAAVKMRNIKEFWKDFFNEIIGPIGLAFVIIHILFIASYYILHAFGIF